MIKKPVTQMSDWFYFYIYLHKALLNV